MRCRSRRRTGCGRRSGPRRPRRMGIRAKPAGPVPNTSSSPDPAACGYRYGCGSDHQAEQGGDAEGGAALIVSSTVQDLRVSFSLIPKYRLTSQ